MCIRTPRHINQRPKLPVISNGFRVGLDSGSMEGVVQYQDRCAEGDQDASACGLDDALGIAELPAREIQCLASLKHNVVSIKVRRRYVS